MFKTKSLAQKKRIISDIRLIIIFSSIMSFMLWSSYEMLNYISFIVIGAIALISIMIEGKRIIIKNKTFIKLYFMLIIYWSLVDFTIAYLFENNSTQEINASHGTLLLSFKLFCTFILSLLLINIGSPIEIGIAVSWLLSYIMPRSYWKVALSISLMLQLITKFKEIFYTTKIGINIRMSDASNWIKYKYIIRNMLISIFENIEVQSIAIIARSLDKKEVWVMKSKQY